jgi:hypothetical protein
VSESPKVERKVTIEHTFGFDAIIIILFAAFCVSCVGGYLIKTWAEVHAEQGK